MDQLQIGLTFLCGLLFQAFFLWLPIELKNWHDDLLNILTYLAVQSFSAGILFFILPTVIDVYYLSWTQGSYLFLVLNTVAFLRVIAKIPLEKSFVVTAEVEAVERIVFSDLYSDDKAALIDAASSRDEANFRVERIRQTLVRVNRERSLLRGSTPTSPQS
jgi:hypothetical protein